MRASCEASLKRLKLEQFPLYYLHYPDPKVPYEDSVGELARLQKEGKIRHIGVSNINADQLATARSLVSVAAVSNPFNVLMRDSDALVATCERDKMVFVPFSPLGGRSAAVSAEDTRLPALKTVADRRQIDLPRAALAWLLARSPVILPIPGTTRVDHLDDNIQATTVRLTTAELAEIG